jgi:glycosyltransferase involved in cell wall biosynthesis
MPSRIAVCSPVGDPLSAATWSGTPAAICTVLRERGRLGPTLDSSNYGGRVLPRVAQRLSQMYYGQSFDIGRGRFERWLRSRLVQKKFSAAGATDVLHTSTYDLPLHGRTPTMRHFLFCDSTWNLWSKHATTLPLYNAKLVSDSERLERTAYRQMTHIFPISEYVRANLIEHYNVPPERVTAVGTGRGAIHPFTGSKDPSRETILFVAKERFEDKGGAMLIEGFKLARRIRPTLRLTVLGDERYRQALRAVPNVEVHGYVSSEQLQQLFNESILFAMPALNEPWGLVYLEALSCRMPVLGLNRNALPEITQGCRFGFCVDTATPEAICATLLDAFSDRARLERMGVEGQAYCLANYTWERTVGRIVETIDRTAAGGG